MDRLPERTARNQTIQAHDNSFVQVGDNYNIAKDLCLADLRCTDPRDDRTRLEQTKGGLLRDSYRWLLSSAEFQQWRDGEDSRLLWIKGDPGKGKTMLLCGIIHELTPSTRLAEQADGPLLSYFFCQATDSRINSATSVLRGLIYLLVKQQPSLLSHVQAKYDDAGKALFADANAWFALSDIFTNILRELGPQITYLVVDALDECVEDRPKLLELMVQSSARQGIRWVVSSRNTPDIERKLRQDQSQARLHLEIKENAEQVAVAVDSYIQHHVSELPSLQGDPALQQQVEEVMRRKANGTFLWVSLVMEELRKAESWEVEEILDELPSGLENLYSRTLEQIGRLGRGNPDLCRLVLSAATTAFRPLCLDELGVVSGLPDKIAEKPQSIAVIVSLCGSFLTMREGYVFIVHQSAKDFLSQTAFGSFFPYAIEEAHRRLFSRSLAALSRTLKRDMYGLKRPGYPIDEVTPPKPDPLAKVQYSCLYWVDHVHDSRLTGHAGDLQDGGSIDTFLRQSYLYWLEALSLLKGISAGILAMAKLERLLQVYGLPLVPLVHDQRRLIQSFRFTIENSPLQVYASVLVFSPDKSMTKKLFEREYPDWIATKPAVDADWNACVLTLEDPTMYDPFLAFSPDGRSLASTSGDGSVVVWDPATGARTQEPGVGRVALLCVAFSPDGRLRASGCGDATIEVFSTSIDGYLHLLDGHILDVTSVVFSPDSRVLASASDDYTVKIWDMVTGACMKTLTLHTKAVSSVAFSPDGRLLASASMDESIRLWDPANWACVELLTGHTGLVSFVMFSPDDRLLASASGDRTVKIWDRATWACTKTLEGHDAKVMSVAFSRDGQLLASGSTDQSVKIWSLADGTCIQSLIGHSDQVCSVVFSPNGQVLASASTDNTIRLWDPNTGGSSGRPESDNDPLTSVACFQDGQGLVALSRSGTCRIWDMATTICLQTFTTRRANNASSMIHQDGRLLVSRLADGSIRLYDGVGIHVLESRTNLNISIAISQDGQVLAAVLQDNSIRLWDLATRACTHTLGSHTSSVVWIVLSPDGQLLASVSRDKVIRVWDLTTGACTKALERHTKVIDSIVFSRDGELLISVSRDGTARLWDPTNGACTRTITHVMGSHEIALSPDGRFLALEILRPPTSVVIRIFNLATGIVAQTLESNSNPFQWMAFSPDSQLLASASWEDTKVWDLTTGDCTLSLPTRGRIRRGVFDPTGSYLVTNVGEIALGSYQKEQRISLGRSRLHLRGYNFLSEGWLALNDEKILWLPPEYRPRQVAVAGSTIAIATLSGRLLILKLRTDRMAEASLIGGYL